MNKKKLGMTIGSLALVGAIAVGGTLAYLSDTTDVVKNTFTVSDAIDIVLDEQEYNNPVPNRVLANTYDDVLPGLSYDKDPTVTVVNYEVSQYVFMAVKTSNDVNYVADTVDWEDVSETVQAPDGYKVYKYNTVVSEATEDYNPVDDGSMNYQEGIQLTPLFTEVTVDSDLNTGSQQLENIEVRAAAVQSDGFTDWENAYAQISAGLLNF